MLVFNFLYLSLVIFVGKVLREKIKCHIIPIKITVLFTSTNKND